MEIRNPRRVLAVGAPDSGVLKLLQDLTGSAPAPAATSTAGLSHEWPLVTKYYKVTLTIWVDEITDVPEWRTEFTKPEAREVVTVLGAWLYCFRKPITKDDLAQIKETMQAIAAVIERACGYGGDQVCLAVAMPQSTTPYLDMATDEWEEITMEHGFEYVDFEETGKNEFSEGVGVQRAREALEACDWENSEGLEFGDDDGDEEGFGGFAVEEAEMNMELFGMKSALHGLDDEDLDEEQDEAKDVEELEVLMRKAMAIKDMGEGMEEAERKRFAAKAINDLMKDV